MTRETGDRPEERKNTERQYYWFEGVILPLSRQLALFLYTVGCRLGEAKKLQWSQVDWSARMIRVSAAQTKNDRAQTIPLADEVFERHSAVPEKERVGALFPVGNFRKAWQTACGRAGLGSLDKTGENAKINGRYGKYSGLHIHDLRRSAVRNLREEGISEGVAMSVSGHKTREVFERYNIVIEADKTAADAKVGPRLTKALCGSRTGQARHASRARK